MGTRDDETVRLGDAQATHQDKPERASKPTLLRPAPEFGPRYRVIAEIGRGGMGEVYRAYDTELRGEVALKTVRYDRDALDEALERFRREIALARKVTSPNVLRVYDFAEHDGLPFLSMEYVEGEDLAALLKREGKLPVERALAIVRQIAAGLAAAHEQDVVHRDLKPKNVLLDREGRVHIADFGLARLIGDSGVTATGAIVGSPTYMAPEQVKGGEVDQRSDIYSLGVMLYQMIVGEPPFCGATPHAVMEMRLHKTPQPLREIDPQVPSYVEAVVERCLRVDADKRYPTVRALLADLDNAPSPPSRRSKKRVLALAAGVAVASGGVIAALAWPDDKPSAPAAVAPLRREIRDPMVNVLVFEFENRSTEPVLADAIQIAFEILLRRSVVCDPYGAMRLVDLSNMFGDPPLPVDDNLARKLGDRDGRRVVVVRGFVAPRGASFVISIVAKDVHTGEEVLRHDEQASQMSDIIRSTHELAIRLRRRLGEQTTEAADDLGGLSKDPEAVHDYVLGRTSANAGNAAGAVDHLQAALAKDPKFPLARIALANSLFTLGRNVESREQVQFVLSAIDQIGERDRLKFLGDYHLVSTGDYERSIAAYTKLLRKWPRDPSAQNNISIAYSLKRDMKSALEAARRAARDNPRFLGNRVNLIGYLLSATDFEAALIEAETVIGEFPRPQAVLFEYRGIAAVLAGKRDLANASFDKFAQLDPSFGATAKADLAMFDGRLDDAQTILNKGIAHDKANDIPDGVELKQIMLAELHLRLGQKAQARSLAERVYKEPSRQFRAALVLLATDGDKRALAIAKRLATDIAPDPRMYAKLIEGERLRLQGKPVEAMLVLQDAIKISDAWYAHVLLGRAALDAGKLAQAYSEFQLCLQRRGEGAMSLDDTPTLRQIPSLTYYLARSQEGMGSPEARTSYKAFIAMQPDAKRDPLVLDAQRRLAQ